MAEDLDAEAPKMQDPGGEMRCADGGGVGGIAVKDSDSMQCCCGRERCVFLRHNCAVLDTVEKDLFAAAKVGKTLLQRHEAYMESAERDRLVLAARIEKLESEKAELQTQNQRTIDENRALTAQLEMLHNTVGESDARVQALEGTLRDSQREVRRLELATERAAAMERHIALLEEEQASLHNTLTYSQEDARMAMHRWREAERGLNDLQREFERMEKEAREEKKRHAEVLVRMERQRALEKDLNTAAGRLKGAAAARSFTEGSSKKGGSSVVNHFVRDLMLDNANLQNSMAEMRETLMNAQNEIENLREQLVYHQPLVHAPAGSPEDGEVSAASTLRAELDKNDRPPTSHVSQELHIHHHYHIVAKPEPKRPKKKRLGLSTAMFSPPQVSSSPSTPQAPPWQLGHSLPSTSLVSHGKKASTLTPSAPSDPRWSLFSDHPSDFAPSSVPSSPQSNPRSSMFDRSIADVSTPTSPTTSLDPLSPTWHMSHGKRGPELSTRGLVLALSSSSPYPHAARHHRASSATQPHPLMNIIREGDLASPDAHESYTTDDLPDLTCTVPTTDGSTIDTIISSSEDEVGAASDDGDDGNDIPPYVGSPAHVALQTGFDPIGPVEHRRTLRHVVSHESIMSLKSIGMDLHTLKARPSQLTLRPLGMATAAGANLSSVTARPTLSRADKLSSLNLRDNLNSAGVGLGLPIPRLMDHASSRVVSESGSSNVRQQPSIKAFTRFVSWRPWANQSPHLGSLAPPQIEVSPTNVEVHSSPSPTVSNTTPTMPSSSSDTPTPTPTLSISPRQDQHLPSPTLSQLSASSGSSMGGPAMHFSRLTKGAGDVNRASGINQPGAIPGFQEYLARHQRNRPPAKVCPSSVDTEALREVLEE